MSKNREKLLVIGHVWPQPNATAAGEHMMHLLECFSRMDFELFFASAANIPDAFQFSEMYQIKMIEIEMNNDSFDDLLIQLQPDVVLFDRFMVEEQFSWRVKESCPNAIRILDTEDLHFLRKQREASFKGKTLIGLSDIAKRELASIYRSDLSLIISTTELNLLTEEYSIPSSILFYFPLLSEERKIAKHNYKEKKDLFFIGNFLHEPNWQTVLKLKKEIWPQLSKQLPDVHLNIYGSHAQQKHLQLHNPKERFHVLGYVEDVSTVFEAHRLLIAPIPFGAGQKGKFLKAMEYNLPFITSKIGAEAMFLEDQLPHIICDSDKAFIDAVYGLYTNETFWNTTQQKMSHIIKDHFDKETFFESFKKQYLVLKKTIENHRNGNVVGQLFWHHSLRSTEYMGRWITEKNKNL